MYNTQSHILRSLTLFYEILEKFLSDIICTDILEFSGINFRINTIFLNFQDLLIYSIVWNKIESVACSQEMEPRSSRSADVIHSDSSHV